MTCVAFDRDGYVAWDSQITVDTARLTYSIDKVWKADGKIYAFAGDIPRMDSVIEWHRAGAVPDTAPKGTWSLLVVGKRTSYIYTEDAAFPSKVRAPFAMGSGGPYALGALSAGASAFDAVKIAAKYDTATGGKINVIHRSDAK